MRIQSRIFASIAASLIVSAVIAFFAFSVVRGIGDDLARGRYYVEVIRKTYALNLLVATFEQESGPRALQQLGEVRASLTRLLDNLSSSDVREQSLIRQIQRNNQELGPLLDQFLTLKTEQNNALRAERKDMLAAQLYTKARFISDDTSRLMEISQSRIVSAHAKAGITVLLFLIILIAANVVISLVSGRSIVRMQVDLQKQREWLQVTLSSIGDAVIATDTESKISFINPVASALTGWPIEEALGGPVQNLFRIVNEKTREPAEDIVGRVLREGGNVTLANHTALVARDGREIPIEDSAAPIKESAGRVAGVVLVFHDVTRKRRAEEALRRSAQFPEENPNPILRIAVGGELLYANAPARKWLETFGAQAEGALPAPVGAVVAHACAQDHAAPAEISNPAGSTFWVTAAQPHGEDYVNLYSIDITDRKRAEEALQEAHAQLQDHALQLEETNRELEGFAYTISHDLRAPLRAINGFAHMLDDDYGPSFDAEGKRRLAVIEANAVKMGLLIDDLLAFSRAGRAAMNVSPIDMNRLMADILETLKTSEPGVKADIQVAGLPPAQGDAALIRQVLANLIENAVKFSRKRQDPRIEVGSLEQDGERVYFVKDNGIGFDSKYYDKLFGVFQRLVTEKEFEGTGVGLAIVHRLVARHGGRVWAEAKPGEGATFFFTLGRKQ